MASTSDMRKVIKDWYREFNEDEDQISIGIDAIEDGFLRLSCGAGFIIFSFQLDGTTGNIITISSKGTDKFVNKLVVRCSEAFLQLDETNEVSSGLKDFHGLLRSVLLKFSEIAKDMAYSSNRSASPNEFVNLICLIKVSSSIDNIRLLNKL